MDRMLSGFIWIRIWKIIKSDIWIRIIFFTDTNTDVIFNLESDTDIDSDNYLDPVFLKFEYLF